MLKSLILDHTYDVVLTWGRTYCARSSGALLYVVKFNISQVCWSFFENINWCTLCTTVKTVFCETHHRYKINSKFCQVKIKRNVLYLNKIYVTNLPAKDLFAKDVVLFMSMYRKGGTTQWNFTFSNNVVTNSCLT